MKTFKQYLTEAKIDNWSKNVVSEMTNSGILVDIIARFGEKPNIRFGNKEYTIEDPKYINKVYVMMFHDDNAKDYDEEELRRLEKERNKFLDKEEENIRKEVLKLMQKFDDGLKDILKKYKAK